jgi:hypothetical protein
MRALPVVGAFPAIIAFLFVDDATVAGVLLWVTAAAVLACAFVDQNAVVGRLRSSSWYVQDEHGADVELRPDAVSIFRLTWVFAAAVFGVLGYLELF